MHRVIGMKDLLIGLGLLSCPAIVFAVFGTSGLDAFDEGTAAPASSQSVQQGGISFAEECAGCHGRLGRGTERGPNLIHPDFGPRVLSDARIRRAVREGVPARPGVGYRGGTIDMPPASNLSERSLNRMVTFLREIQRANGIR
jgi:mono/diheme cytochrome c family protein